MNSLNRETFNPKFLISEYNDNGFIEKYLSSDEISLNQIRLGVVKNFADVYNIDCSDILKKIKSYRKTLPVQGENLNRLDCVKSFVRRDILNQSSLTPHTFDSYIISFSPEDALSEITKDIFFAMQKFDGLINERSRGFKAKMHNEDKKFSLRPQIIHYPLGGGFFDWHAHNKVPQYYGLIFNLSKRGIDYSSGSARFRIDGKEVSVDELHQEGSLIFFQFDLEHCVDYIQPVKANIDWEFGRWSAVLPLL